MTDDRLEIAREAARRFDAEDVDGVMALYTDDPVLIAPEGWPDGGPFRGQDAVRGQFTRLIEDWEEHALTILGEASAGDWVVLDFHWDITGRASGAAGQMRIAGAYRFADDKIAEARFFWDFDHALRDVGIAA